MIFIVVKVFPFMVITLGAHGSYYVFAGMCIAKSVFCFFCIPETRGKSTAELQRLYQKSSQKI